MFARGTTSVNLYRNQISYAWGNTHHLTGLVRWTMQLRASSYLDSDPPHTSNFRHRLPLYQTSSTQFTTLIAPRDSLSRWTFDGISMLWYSARSRCLAIICAEPWWKQLGKLRAAEQQPMPLLPLLPLRIQQACSSSIQVSDQQEEKRGKEKCIVAYYGRACYRSSMAAEWRRTTGSS